MRGGRQEDAVAALKIALWSEETVEAPIALAEAYLQAQDTASAQTEVDRALELDPSSEAAADRFTDSSKWKWDDDWRCPVCVEDLAAGRDVRLVRRDGHEYIPTGRPRLRHKEIRL